MGMVGPSRPSWRVGVLGVVDMVSGALEGSFSRVPRVSANYETCQIILVKEGACKIPR